MLTIIRSPTPGVLQAARSLPEAVARLLEHMAERPERFAWVVPTGRRKRALVKDWLAFSPSRPSPLPRGKRGELPLFKWLETSEPDARGTENRAQVAAILPRFFTLESFVAEALQYGVRQKPRISGPERLLRLAAAWHDLAGRAAGSGVIHQLDRYIRDCQACRLPLDRKSGDIFERLAATYVKELTDDNRLDRMSAVATLVEEISNKESWPNRMFIQRFDAILIDGFHRFESVELDLIAALSHVRDVVLWLVGIPGQPSWKTIETATAVLKEKGERTTIADRGFEDSAPATPFGEIGRRLFRSAIPAEPRLRHSAKPQAMLGGGKEGEGRLETTAGRSSAVQKPPGLFKLEVASPLDEVEAVARQIKAEYLDSQKTGRPLRLSDVAVIIPGPAYDPLVREVFPRAGLEFNLAGRALLISTSRPARVLLSAVNLIQGRWRYDLLLDFLNQPLVHRKLDNAHRLDDLFEHRPRLRQRMNHPVWSRSWKNQLERLNKCVEGWRLGRLDLPERTTLSRDEYVNKKVELAADLNQLVLSIEKVLGPIEAMERAFENASEDRPLRNLIEAMDELLELLEIDRWLTPPPKKETPSAVLRTAAKRSTTEGPVLWVEYEKDQNAYLKLRSILHGLKDVPASRMPKRGDGRPDVLAALRLALDGETYQIKTEDDAGVQLFELREIRGLRFRHVYVLGLVHGQIPTLPEEGTLVRRRRLNAKLNAHLDEKEGEVQFFFSQVFEAAQEKLVLSRPMLDDDRPTLPSPFFTAVDDLVTLPELKLSPLVTGKGEAASWLGRASANNIKRKSLSDLWPDISPESAGDLAPILDGLTSWQQRPAGHELAVDWPEMMQALFPDEHQFSPSQLETYAACPFRFFGEHVLRLEEREADPMRMHYGSLVHRVLQKVYSEKRKDWGTIEGPLPPLTRDDRDLLVRIFKEEESLLDDGLLSPDLGVMFVSQGGVIDLFLEILEAVEGQPEDFGNLFSEYPLDKVELGTDASGRPVLLTGKIDRVDVKRSSSGAALIIDYKTAGSPRRALLETKMGDGRMLQLPLYAAALQIAQPGLNVIGAAYIHLSEKAKKKAISKKEAIVSLDQLGKKEPETDPWNTRLALEMALDFAGQIRAGQFGLTRHGNGSDEAECTDWCPLRHACRHPEGYATSNW